MDCVQIRREMMAKTCTKETMLGCSPTKRGGGTKAHEEKTSPRHHEDKTSSCYEETPSSHSDKKPTSYEENRYERKTEKGQEKTHSDARFGGSILTLFNESSTTDVRLQTHNDGISSHSLLELSKNTSSLPSSAVGNRCFGEYFSQKNHSKNQRKDKEEKENGAYVLKKGYR